MGEGRSRSEEVLRDAADVLAALRKGGARLREVRFTQNRRVMASLQAGGDTLRIHECFAGAPDLVLQALGSLYASAGHRDRVQARQVVRDFLRQQSPPPPKARRRTVSASDRPMLERLRQEFERVNAAYFDAALPAVPIFLSGRMKRRNGHFSTHPVEIVISRRLFTEAAAGEAERTLRHEMIHLWHHVLGIVGICCSGRPCARR